MIRAAKTFAGRLLKMAGSIFPADYPIGTRFLSDDKGQIYFGYYDVTPFDQNNKRILALRTFIGNVSPHDKEDSIELGYFDLSDSRPAFQPFALSHSWNWQQGCRLQWFPTLSDHVIYNDYKNKKFVSCLFNISENRITQEFDAPLYAVSPNGDYALTLDFSRLHKFRPGYGYSNTATQNPDPSTAVDRLNLSTGSIQSLISYKMIRQIKELKNVNGYAYINHISCSPNGERFIFFFITYDQGKRQTYLLTAHADGSNLSLLTAYLQPSHYTWKNNNEILITAKEITGEIGYFLINCETQSSKKLDGIYLNKDGHPSLINDQDFISDTYPDRMGHQKIFRQTLSGNSYRSIAHFHLPPSFSGERRCDLHPRLSSDNKIACVDIIRQGRRCMALIPLNGQ